MAQEIVSKWIPWKIIEDTNEDNHFDRDKKRRINLNDEILIFIILKKLKIDKLDESICENKLGDDDIEVVKFVPSLVIGKYHSRVRCSWGKGHDRYYSTCPCLVPHY